MEGHREENMTTEALNMKWTKSKRKAFLRAYMGRGAIGVLSESKGRILAWPAQKFDAWAESVAADTHPGTLPPLPPGAMAPKNTTQYLMDLVYTEQLKVSTEAYGGRPLFTKWSRALNKENIFLSSHFGYDRSFDFQQRDFDNVFFRNEI